MISSFFISGTDTDAGKTVITAGLLRALSLRAIRAMAVKPVQTGCLVSGQQSERAHSPACGLAHSPSCELAHLKDSGTAGLSVQVAEGLSDEAVYLRALAGCPPQGVQTATWLRYRRACSPHLAAVEEQRPIELEDLAARHAALAVALEAECAPRTGNSFSAAPAVLLLEGAGGVLVPLGPQATTRDLIARLNATVILVVPNRLGAIHQALASLEALAARGLAVLGVVLTRTTAPTAADDELVCADHAATIARMGAVPVLADVNWLEGLSDLSASAAVQLAAWDSLVAQLEPVLAALLAAAKPLPTDRQKAILDFDRRHLWHPYSSTTEPLPCREAVSAHGTRIRLADGRELVDGMSSWWCAIHGYGHPVLQAAVHQQVQRMSHVMFGGLTHEPAVKLGRMLRKMLPSGLSQIFFADSGSIAVEVAMKMAMQYRQARGEGERTQFISLRGGYHGDSFGAMSVCDPVTGMHSLFSGMLRQQVFAPRPSCRFDAVWDPSSTRDLEALLAQHASRCTAIIVEPVVQGAGGMWMYHPEYLRQVRSLCDAHGLLLICDEIATGFGRTGRLFAVDWAGVHPDIMCVGKALTGGMMSLAATGATQDVADTIAANKGVLMHGPTFMANPLACAVAVASVQLLAETAWQEQVAQIAQQLESGLAPCREHPDVADVRVLGAIGVVELRHSVDLAALQDFFVEACGVWIRPFGRLVYLMPPYTSTAEDISRLTGAICRAVCLQKTGAAAY